MMVTVMIVTAALIVVKLPMAIWEENIEFMQFTFSWLCKE